MSDSNCTLSHTWDEQKHNPVGWYMSEKLDGMRAIWNGRTLVSRNNKPIHAPEWWTATLPKDKTLDGELWTGRGKFQELVSATRTKIPLDQRWRTVGYLVFDVIAHGRWEDRFNIHMQHPVIPVTHYKCHSLAQMTEFYNSVVDNGGEGIMLRDPDMPYVFGRSWKLLKVKPEHEMIAEVLNHLPGEGKYTGMLGSLVCKDTAGLSVMFSVGSGLTDADRTEKYAPKIGSKIKVRYSSLTDGGISLRFPRFIERM